jgi:glucose-1-phosphate thymidylyltransferase
MIDLPIQTLKDMGCEDIVLVSGGEHIGHFAEYLGEDFTYRVQSKPNGIAKALKCAEGLVSGLFPVILGDNFFSYAPGMPNSPAIFTKIVRDPNRFGVYAQGKITEKPTKFLGSKAVTGLYVYDERVFDMIDSLTPSARGEYEVTDLNNQYLKLGALVIDYDGYWSDMGTPDSLLQVANFRKDLTLNTTMLHSGEMRYMNRD